MVELIQRALDHQRAGQIAEAEKIYWEILQTQPEQPDALALLATIALSRGNIDSAIELLGRATVSNPNFADAFKSRAALLARRGLFDAAVECYRRAAEISPGDFKTHFELGKLLIARQEFNGAIEALGRAVELRPDFAEAHNCLGNALSRIGRPDEALAEYQKAVMLRPEYIERLRNVGRMMQEKGRLDDAIAAYMSIVELVPTAAGAQMELGEALSAAGNPEEAVAVFQNASITNHRGVEVHVAMAVLLAKLERFDEAMLAYACAEALTPQTAETLEALGQIQLYKLNAEEAVDSFRRALEVDPNRFSSIGFLADALKSLGRFDEAADCYHRMISLRPDLVAGFSGLSSVGRLRPGQPEMERILDLLKQGDLSSEKRVAAEFALGKSLDAANEFDEAFKHYRAANLEVKKQRTAMGRFYDRASAQQQVSEIIGNFSVDFFEERKGWGDTSETPVFVVGMPRSGTTLVQQVAAGHWAVGSAGESRGILDLARSFRASDFRSDPLLHDRNEVSRISAEYIRNLRAGHPGAERVLDKLPSNVYRLGMIAVLFPGARIILCRRDARDNCLSCYFQNFFDANAFSFDLADCGHEYRACNRLMDYWLRALPLRMLEVKYEDMVANLEVQSRRLIEFLGLPWDAACLDFHRTPGTILTSSDWQVRQPLYQSSVGRWRHYEKHLGPLLDVVGR